MIKKEPINNNTQVLVGQNFFGVYYQTKIRKYQDLNYSPHWALKPYAKTPKITADPSGVPRIVTDVSLGSNDDTIKDLESNYSMKSMMSLDGLLSPISFYPTPYSSTFHITKYPTPCCPFCNGTRSYTYRMLPDQVTANTQGINAIDKKDTYSSSPLLCPFCEPVIEKEKKILKSASPRESYPPFIVASGEDLEIISVINTSGASGMPIINYGTLNPFILSSGEFGNFQNKQSGDLTGFSIDLVAYGMMTPRSGDGLRPFYSRDIFSAYQDRDVTIEKWYSGMVAKQINLPPLPASGRKNNIRSFGLRGPIMLHSWGYDIEGFPVPNSSGEPLMLGGQPVYESGFMIGKNQKQVRGPNGNLIWTKPYKENTFYKGWGHFPSTWPVGPIDFRWDEVAGVWTVGSNYKPVFIALEEDLVNRQPVRGSIIDSSQSSIPLPSGLRKLVFVRDPIGNFSAPRGAAIYCRYDSNNGFYEPIARTSHVTSGIIRSATAVEIYKIYSPIPDSSNLDLSQPPVVEKYQAPYTNPLNFKINTGGTGLFIFIGSGWVLQSYNCS